MLWRMKCAELHKSLGERIRSLRKEQHISQERLAELADLNLSYLSEIERGLANVSLGVVDSIAEALGVSLTELFAGISKGQASDDILILLHQLQTLNEKQIRAFLKSAQGILDGIREL